MKKLILCLMVICACLQSYGHGGNQYEHKNLLKSMDAGDKAAILIVHFGTTHDDTRDKTIEAINKKVTKEFSPMGFNVVDTYSSRIIIKRLADRGITKENPLEKLNNLADMGYTHVIVQPTTIIDGVEMESIERNIGQVKERFKDIRLSTPLLYAPEDYENAIAIITSNLNPNKAYLFVGHGTYDATTAQYAMLDYMLKAQGFKNCIVGTIEGYPSFEDATNQLAQLKDKQITLIPLMFVAGEHAKNDIAEDWKDELQKQGYQVDVILEGLGENSQIQDLYVQKIKFQLNHKKRDIMDKKKIYEKTGEVLE